MVSIILDTNILRQDLLFRSAAFRRLLEFSVKTGSVIVVPQMVMDEILRLYSKELENLSATFTKTVNGIRKLVVREHPIMEAQLDNAEYCRDYREHIHDTLDAYCLQIPPVKDNYLSDVLRRWKLGLKPMSDNGAEFRDALIWQTALDYALGDKHYPTAFISANTRDFANAHGDDFHPHLKEELGRLGVEMKFYSSLDYFIRNYASDIDFITREWLIENIDWEHMNNAALKHVEEIDCTPFFMNYDDEILGEDASHWKVKSAFYNREVVYFFVVRRTGSDQFKLEISCKGVTEIRYYGISGAHYDTSIRFAAQMFIEVTAQRHIIHQRQAEAMLEILRLDRD